MKTILITGVTGFAGSFLAEHVLSADSDTYIVGTYVNEQSLVNISNIKDRITTKKVDLTSKEQMQQLIAQTKPDEVYHLAALTSQAQSFSSPTETLTNNIAAQVELFEVLRSHNVPNIKVLITSSAEVYGAVSANDLPMDEETPFKPQSPYAVSKLTQDFLAYQYAVSYDMHIVRVRPFNHIGPRQSPNFVVSAFAKQIAAIEKGDQEPVIRVGNLEAKRDFTDVRDMVSAYVLALGKGQPSEAYNIGSDISQSIQSVLDHLLSLSTAEIKVKTDNDKIRPSDTPELLCNSSKFRSLTGWKPTISFEKTLQDTLAYWRDSL